MSQRDQDPFRATAITAPGFSHSVMTMWGWQQAETASDSLIVLSTMVILMSIDMRGKASPTHTRASSRSRPFMAQQIQQEALAERDHAKKWSARRHVLKVFTRVKNSRLFATIGALRSGDADIAASGKDNTNAATDANTVEQQEAASLV